MAINMFLKIDGIEGASADTRHKNEIDILSYAWGESQLVIREGGGRSTNKPV